MRRRVVEKTIEFLIDAGGGADPVQGIPVGLLGALGIGVGLVIWGMVSTLSAVLLYVGLALFVVLGMDPLISCVQRKGVPRPVAVTGVFLCVLGSVAAVL